MHVLDVHIGELRPVEIGEGADFARADPGALVAVGAVDLEAAEALVHVGDKARLAHLAVGDDIDADFGLLGDDVGDRLAHARVEFRLVDFFAVAARDDHGVEVGRPRQAADMGGQNPITAASHCISSDVFFVGRSLTPISRAHSRAWACPSAHGAWLNLADRPQRDHRRPVRTPSPCRSPAPAARSIPSAIRSATAGSL